jgi:hypothetical protein
MEAKGICHMLHSFPIIGQGTLSVPPRRFPNSSGVGKSPSPLPLGKNSRITSSGARFK